VRSHLVASCELADSEACALHRLPADGFGSIAGGSLMTPWSEEAKLLVLGLTVAVVVAGSAYTVTALLAAGADREKAAVEAATMKAQSAATAVTEAWQGRATAAETNQGNEHAAIDALRAGLSALSVPNGAGTVHAGVLANPRPAGGSAASAAAVVRQNVVCPSSNDLRSDYGEALRADGVVADERALYNSWPVSPPR
jgi:hypothetical protein